MDNVTVQTIIGEDATYHGNGDIKFEYGEPTVLDGTVERYQCYHCGFVLGHSSQEVFDWLQERDMIEFDEFDEEDKKE